ncbi:outer dense fiber protein 2-like isoform X1 [Synchiropus splendidus]|uniref:outer dense fiber protein 2-like isoform X1 n=1 Tax=Synchiropus splendidus TaxID=270530 RepID=UPI00237DE688|nr:outer dense fiber protein 2-like isoform X1 [Synchiropus splendidus]
MDRGELRSDVHGNDGGLAAHAGGALENARKSLSSFTSTSTQDELSSKILIGDVMFRSRLLMIPHERVDRTDAKSQMMKILTEAEAAANSAAIQLVSFKDELEDKVAGKRASAADRQLLTRQRGLLLERLDDFRRINKTVRQKLKQLQHAESCRVEADRQIDELMRRITLAEKENELLKSNLIETERRVEELTGLRQEEQENMKMVVHKARSVEATQSHLQTQVWNKEAEKDGLTLQLQTLKRTVAEQKTEMDHLNGVIRTLKEKAQLDREILKRANRAQRLRAERFEAAIQKCSAQLKKKDVQLASVCSERDSRRRLKEQTTLEKEQVVAQVAVLKREVAALTSRLQWEKDEMSAASALVMQRVETLMAENHQLSVDKATLKTCVSELEQQLTDCEAALIREKVQSQERKEQSEQRRLQVTELEAEVSHLRGKYSDLLEQTSAAREGKERRVDKVRQELQRISGVKQELCQCRQNLRREQSKSANLGEAVRLARVQMASQTRLLMSSEEMSVSIQEANAKLRDQVYALHRRMELLCQEKCELERSLRAQEEAQSHSTKQLDERAATCQSLSRQLEAALLDVKHQVDAVSQQAAAREEVLQVRILELEAEKSTQENQLRLLQQSKSTAEKRFQLRVKNLQLSLERAESHKQSIQNFVDLLKNSFHTMSAEGT